METLAFSASTLHPNGFGHFGMVLFPGPFFRVSAFKLFFEEASKIRVVAASRKVHFTSFLRLLEIRSNTQPELGFPD